MLIEAVILFGLLSALFEALILMKVSPRIRLRLLGSPLLVTITHFVVIIFNLIVHFGTITGTMSAIVAGLASFAVIPLTRAYSGYIRTLEINGRREPRYFAGTKRYPLEIIR